MEDIIGENGLLKQLTKAVLERAMQAEMTEHLGYEKHDPAGHNSGNSRNGATTKTLKGDFGEVRLETPREFPESIVTVFPEAQVQLCIVHQVRASLNYVSWKQRKIVAADLQPIYRASAVEEAEQRVAPKLRASHAVLRLSSRNSQGDLHHQLGRVAEYELAQGDQKASPRGLPIRFEEVPAVKRPRRHAAEEAWAAYRLAAKQRNLSQRAVELLRMSMHIVNGLAVAACASLASRPIAPTVSVNITSKILPGTIGASRNR